MEQDLVYYLLFFFPGTYLHLTLYRKQIGNIFSRRFFPIIINCSILEITKLKCRQMWYSNIKREAQMRFL